MLRSLLGATAVTTALALGLPAGPASATRSGDPLEGLQVHPEWGSVTGHGGVLKRGCRTYTFSYSITPPEGVWALEVFITGPRQEHVANTAFLQYGDATSGTGTYKLCGTTTRHGRFTIDAKLSVDDDGHMTEGRLPSDHYRLRRKHHH